MDDGETRKRCVGTPVPGCPQGGNGHPRRGVPTGETDTPRGVSLRGKRTPREGCLYGGNGHPRRGVPTFHTKNTPVYWGRIHPINQKCSLVQRKKFIGMKNLFCSYYHLFIGLPSQKEKARNPLRPNQNWAASALFS